MLVCVLFCVFSLVAPRLLVGGLLLRCIYVYLCVIWFWRCVWLLVGLVVIMFVVWVCLYSLGCLTMLLRLVAGCVWMVVVFCGFDIVGLLCWCLLVAA